MTETHGTVTTPEAPGNGAFSFEVSDVTDTITAVVTDVEPSIPVGTVASALASRMSLPSNVPWTLRDETSSVFLDDNRPIGDQIANRAKVTITPKAHLG